VQTQDNLVLETAERVFRDLADPQSIIRQGGDVWKAPLWRALEDTGLPAAWAPESLGGAGLPLSDGYAVIRAAGRAALGVPLADTMVANWALGRAGIPVPAGRIALVLPRGRARVAIDAAGRVDARARKVPFAREADHLLVLAPGARGTSVALVPASRSVVTPGLSLAGDTLDDVEISAASDAHRAGADGFTADRVGMLAATARALQIAGALEAMLEIAVTYSQERVAFGKTISKFQAVQHNLARLGGEVAAAVAVAQSAADAIASIDADDDELLLEVGAAKVRCGEAAEAGAAIAHQVLGAIGFTDEHVLHRFTLRALSWRDEFGDEVEWSRRLATLVAARSSGEFWRLLAAR